jgi:WD40 repeat protein
MLAHPKDLRDAAFGSDDRQVLTIDADGAARLWDTASGRLSRTVLIDNGVARAGLGRHSLLTVDGENRIRILDLKNGKPIGKPVLTSFSDDIIALPDGRRILVIKHLLSGSVAQLWDSMSGRPLGETFPIAGQTVESAISSDGRRLLLASEEGGALVLEIPFGSAADADLLIRWAEAVGGLTVDPSGDLKPVQDQIARLDALRRETAKAPFGQDNAASLIRWFFADPQSRPRSPLSSR